MCRINPTAFRKQWSHRPTPIPPDSTGLWYSEECVDQMLRDFAEQVSGPATSATALDCALSVKARELAEQLLEDLYGGPCEYSAHEWNCPKCGPVLRQIERALTTAMLEALNVC